MDVTARSGSSPMRVEVDGVGEFVTTRVNHDKSGAVDKRETGRFVPIGPAPAFDPLALEMAEMHGSSDGVSVVYDHHKETWGERAWVEPEGQNYGGPVVVVDLGRWQQSHHSYPQSEFKLWRVEAVKGMGGDTAEERQVEAHTSFGDALGELGV